MSGCRRRFSVPVGSLQQYDGQMGFAFPEFPFDAGKWADRESYFRAGFHGWPIRSPS